MSTLLILQSTLLFIALLISSSCSREKPRPNIEKVAARQSRAEADAHLGCAMDDDCISVKADCCGCNQGGKQKAMLRSMEGSFIAEQRKRCGDAICPQVISKDPSCQKKARCVEGRCELK